MNRKDKNSKSSMRKLPSTKEQKLIDLDHLFKILEHIYGLSLVSKWKSGQRAIHLALMQGDFLEFIINGTKVIESRFSKARIAPVGVIDSGDLVLFKQVGKQVMATGVVAKAKSGTLSPSEWKFVRANAEDIGIDEDYMEYKSDARYFALVWMRDVQRIDYIRLDKRDRRSWVVLKPRLGSVPQ